MLRPALTLYGGNYQSPGITLASSAELADPSPTRMNLTLTKGRLKGAQTGHSLLAKKRDALMTRFRTILKKVDEAKLSMGRVLQLASFSLAEVTYTAGDIGYQVQESVRKASYTVQARQENVSGVVLPAFESVRSKEGGGESTCSSAGHLFRFPPAC